MISVEIILIIIGSIETIIITIIGALFSQESHTRKKENKVFENRAKLRQQESLLAISLMSANLNLGIATASALRDGKSNGVTDTALREAEKAETAYKNFINTLAMKKLNYED